MKRRWLGTIDLECAVGKRIWQWWLFAHAMNGAVVDTDIGYPFSLSLIVTVKECSPGNWVSTIV